MIFDITHILINQNFKNQKELFKFLGQKAVEKNIAKDAEVISSAFANRESEGTTGFEDGFAIPHARVAGVSRPTIFVIRNTNNFGGWNALDENGVQYIIALIIPDKSRSLHMDVLSAIATKLLNEEFRNDIKKGTRKKIFESFNKILANINNDQKVINSLQETNKPLLIGISACPAGIAHTFMAKQKMEDSAKELNMNVNWETQGANGQKNPLNKEAIDAASVIIIASDIELDLSRFKGKKIFVTSTNDAIKNGISLIERAKKESKEFTGSYESKGKNMFLSFLTSLKQSFQTSFGKPWIYLSITGTLLAIISLIGYSTYGNDWTSQAAKRNINLFKLQEIAKFALYLSMPFMAGSIAKKSTKASEAFTIAFIGSLLINVPTIFTGWNSITGGNQATYNILFDWNYFETNNMQHGSNIFGAIIVTFITILIIKFIQKYHKFLDINKTNKLFRILRMGSSPWVYTLIPVISVLLGIVYLLGAPLSFISSYATYGMIEYARNYWWLRLIIGGIFGIMISWDLGGIVNKIGLISLIGLAQYDLKFASIISIGIPLASIGYGTTFAFFKKRFKETDAADAALSFRKGLNGMTEGPLFLTHKYKWRVIIPNLASTFLATGLALAVGLYIFKGGHFGILFAGGQADLSHTNDIIFLNILLPRGLGFITAICSLSYGIIAYYLIMFIGSLAYASIASITFAIPGKNKVFK